ncbi:MAG: DMT family transporter [Phormidium sp. BM_Day4_Bin.17]|nr:DMT family transporter [Phormidium sp. BM_Day4_Bin.17]UCJ12614.1 MAG: DMT family transporter [Phormidium sp. PBR-2020]
MGFSTPDKESPPIVKNLGDGGRPPAWRVVLILLLGVLAVSTAAIWVRLALGLVGGEGGLAFTLVMAASRLTVAALLLSGNWRRIPRQVTRRQFWGAALSGLFLALHFAAWISSLSYTSIAASTTLVTTTPLWVALLSWLFLREPISGGTWLGMAIALGGGGLIASGEMAIAVSGSQPWLGNGLALLGAWIVSLHLLLGRKVQQEGLGLAHYVTITYTVAALLLLPLPWLLGGGYGGYPPLFYGYLLLMGLLPQLLGHTSLNWALRWLSPTWVTLAVLLEPISASSLGLLLFGEVPGWEVWLGGIVVLTGVAIAVLGGRKTRSDRDQSKG